MNKASGSRIVSGGKKNKRSDGSRGVVQDFSDADSCSSNGTGIEVDTSEEDRPLSTRIQNKTIAPTEILFICQDIPDNIEKQKKSSSSKKVSNKKKKRKKLGIKCSIEKSKGYKMDKVRDVLLTEGSQDEQGVWICNRCQRPFSTDKTFTHHLRRAHNLLARIFGHRCPVCNKDFLSPEALQRHKKRTHPPESEAEKIREDKEEEKKLLEAHGVQGGNGFWSCSMCGIMFRLERKFLYHLSRVHQIKVNSFRHKCSICDMGFLSTEALSSHVKFTHKGSRHNPQKREEEKKLLEAFGEKDEENFWCCCTCGMRFRAEIKFLYHLSRAHQIKISSFNFRCATCGIEFRSRLAYTNHIRQSHDEKEEVLEAQGSSYNMEILEEHGKKDKYENWLCNNCGDMYNTKEKLIKHLAKVHKLDIKPQRQGQMKHKSLEMGETCGRGDSEKLLEHGMKNDTGSWKCYACGFILKEDIRFLYHLKRAHDIEVKEFKFACIICGRTFFSQNVLNRHVFECHKNTDNVTT